MFEKTATDMIRGIRNAAAADDNNNDNNTTTAYLEQCIDEIKTELNANHDIRIKVNALEKAIHLKLLRYHHDISWTHFIAIHQIMTYHPRSFACKRIAYLAMNQGGVSDDMVLLTINYFKLELRRAINQQQSSAVGNSSKQEAYEIGTAMNCIANIVTPPLARQVLPELMELIMTHSKAHVRKKAMACLFHVVSKNDNSNSNTIILPLVLDKLQMKLIRNDNNDREHNKLVISTAVTLIAELHHKFSNNQNNVDSFMPFATWFLENVIPMDKKCDYWTKITALRFLARLANQQQDDDSRQQFASSNNMLESLVLLVQTGHALSLKIEAIYTIISCIPPAPSSQQQQDHDFSSIVTWCADLLLRDFVQVNNDNNIAYAGLLGFDHLMDNHPAIVIRYRSAVMEFLTDEDITLQNTALKLVERMNGYEQNSSISSNNIIKAINVQVVE